jgi:Fungalysin metallopeptidase (M36)/FG-GAP-like repeat
MHKKSDTSDRRGLLVGLFTIGLILALIILPYQFKSEAGGQKKDNKGLNPITVSHEEGLEDYDIREQKNDEVAEALSKYRNLAGKNDAAIADVRADFARGEDELRTRVPSLKIEYNTGLRIPEVITPDVWKAKIERLTGPGSGKNANKLRDFARQNNELVGMKANQIDQLKEVADYTNPSGSMAFAAFDQVINGIPVFAGELKAGFTVKGEMVRVINNLAPGLDYDSLATDFGNPSEAVQLAFKNINTEPTAADLTVNEARSNNLKTIFGNGDWAPTAEKMYFPTEVGVARAAWRVLIWKPINAYYVIIDAQDGTMLWRKNITKDQTQPATYQVYNNPLSIINSADSPAPMTPGPISPSLGTQGMLATRANVTLIGNEGPLAFNNNGWITDGANATEGNATIAGLDIVAPNGVDAPVAGVGRVFSSAWNPPPGNPAPGDAPAVPAARDGAVIQMFYAMNRYHDALYQLGFTEQARNFQNDNFGRGGVANDRISSEGQDSAGTNNANFSITSDGTAGRMQMFVFTGPTPARDGTADVDIIIHEATHGLSGRLHGNGSGLSNNMSGGMGEGWGDWFGFCLLSASDDPVNGVYAGGGHVLLNGFGSITTDNYYYGIRSFPKATLATTGGPNNLPHNPLTFADIDSLQENRTNGAFAPKSGAHISTTADQVHRAGEVWSSLLWEVRALMITRLGHVAGNQRAMQVVVDGMKLAPIGPTFIQERDAIIAAASALPAAPEAALDVVDVREGFRRRGMGFSAAVTTISPARVVEAFDLPNVAMINPFSVSDSVGDNDGFPEPGENVLLSVAVTNVTGATVTAVTGNANGGANVSYGDVANAATVVRQIPFTVPAASACGSLQQVTINIASAVGAQTPQVREFRLGAPAGGVPIVASNNTLMQLPDGAAGAPAPASLYPSNVTVAGAGGFTNAKLTVAINGYTQTFPGDNDFLLVGPAGQKFSVMTDQGGGTDIINLGFSLTDSAAAALPAALIAGSFKPTSDTTADIFPAPAPVAPYIQPAPGGVGTLASTFGTSGAAMNGTWSLYVVDDAGGDTGTIAGWSLTVESNDFACSVAPSSPRSDFDGDGKTDVSVFRPSEGNWYLNRSTAGFSIVNWGLASDVLAPGDYDGDGKADVAVFRPSASAGVSDFFILNSATSTVRGAEWGSPADVPVVADYDGDNKDDVAIYRPSTNDYFVILSTTGATRHFRWGIAGDIPVPGDFDGDAKAEFAVFRPSNGTWYYNNSTGGAFVAVQWGAAGDVAVFANYDGDSKDDIAVYRPSNGFWYIKKSTGGETNVQWGGVAGDVPVPGDYDGDGKYDQAIYRAGTWHLNRSTSGSGGVVFGLASDRAIPRFYVP